MTRGVTEIETTSRTHRRRRAEALTERFRGVAAEGVLRVVIRSEFYGAIGMVSSFGTDSAVLLHMIAGIDPYVPVIFLDTGKHFPETIAYRRTLCDALGLNNVQRVTPARAWLAADDPDGLLHQKDEDLCCTIRKTRPMLQALRGMSCWITGRKRFQGAGRAALPLFEAEDRWIKVNPLYNWTAHDIEAHFERYDLPRHPLQERGFASISCACCTRAVTPGEDVRAGRWAGSDKTECGIHFIDGKAVRAVFTGEDEQDDNVRNVRR